MTCEAWPIAWPCPTEGVDPELLTLAQELSADLLWAMSGYRLGVCEYVEGYRPACSNPCVVPYKSADGFWRNGRIGDCCRILLGHRPVIDVEQVTELDVVLDDADYVVENGYLRKTTGCWSCALDCDDPAVEVAYRAGIPLPPSTALAVGEVACEVVKALTNQPCKLPSRAVSITRQGVTVDMGSASTFIAMGRLGLPIADAWLDVVGRGPKAPSKVYSPDLPRPVRTLR